MKHLPVWVFHGQKDTVVPHKRSADMVEALQNQGNKKVKFTSYPDEGHNRVLGLAINHTELYEWLLEQERLTPATMQGIFFAVRNGMTGSNTDWRRSWPWRNGVVPGAGCLAAIEGGIA